MVQAVRHSSTQQLRVRSSGERFEPTVVIANGAAEDPSLVVRAASGVAMVVSVGASVNPSGWGLWFDDGRHVLSPLDVAITPVAVGHHDVDDVVALLREPIEPAAEPVVTPHQVVMLSEPWVEPEWALQVRLFGRAEVIDAAGSVAVFERMKALELVVWLSLHRGQSTRSSARTALWEMEVRAATFANVVSDARRGLGRLVVPPADDEWIGRTLTEDLPLHPLVVTDADLLRARVKAARTREGRDAIEVLRPGLELVRGVPLLDTGFLWSDAEGHMSSLVMLATAAAVELGTLYLDEGDADAAFEGEGVDGPAHLAGAAARILQRPVPFQAGQGALDEQADGLHEGAESEGQVHGGPQPLPLDPLVEHRQEHPERERHEQHTDVSSPRFLSGGEVERPGRDLNLEQPQQIESEKDHDGRDRNVEPAVVRERVELVGAVERDPRGRAARLVQNQIVGHEGDATGWRRFAARARVPRSGSGSSRRARSGMHTPRRSST